MEEDQHSVAIVVVIGVPYRPSECAPIVVLPVRPGVKISATRSRSAGKPLSLFLFQWGCIQPGQAVGGLWGKRRHS